MKKTNYLLLALSISLFACAEKPMLETEKIEIEEVVEQPMEETDENDSENLEGSQTDTNLSAEERLLKARTKMNTTYDAILEEYKDEKSFIRNLKISQDLWGKFMEAQMLAVYPEDDDTRERSVFNLCWYGYREELIIDRTASLEVWLKGAREGEACSGTVRISQ